MNDEKLAEIRARHQASWRGPYQWLGYGGRQRKTIDLALTTQYHGKEYIMLRATWLADTDPWR